MRLKKKNDLQSYYANRGNNHIQDFRSLSLFRDKTSEVKLDLILSEYKIRSKKYNQRKFKQEVRSFLPSNPDKGDVVIAHKLALRKMKEERGN